MAHRKPKPGRGKPESPMVIGIGWYDRAQWTKLKQVAADAEKLDDTYEDWLRRAPSVWNERWLAGD